MIELCIGLRIPEERDLYTTCSKRFYWETYEGVSRLNEETLQEGHSTSTPLVEVMRM